MGFEFAVAQLCDAVSATVAGRLIDAGYTANQVAKVASGTAGGVFMLASIYHMMGRGAARTEFNRRPHKGNGDGDKSIAEVAFA